jgi:hypothetical protein
MNNEVNDQRALHKGKRSNYNDIIDDEWAKMFILAKWRS